MPEVSANGIRIHYEEYGSGDPLLLIMGIGAAGSVWERHVDCWRESFRCIVPDNRGVGLSDKPAGPYSSSVMADDMACLLNVLGVKRLRVVGCSMGSIIAQQLALRHFMRVRSMVLMCPWARCDHYARGIFEHLCTIKARLRPEEFMQYIQLLIFAKTSWDNSSTFENFANDRLSAGSAPLPQPLHGFEGQAAACMNHDTFSKLSEIRCPVLAIGGSADIFTPGWMIDEVSQNITGSNLFLYEGAGHAFHWEHIDDFNPRVRDWLLAH